MRTFIGVSLAAGVLACHAAPRTGAAPYKRVLGTFSYSATVSQLRRFGTFTIAPDTVTVEPQEGMCLRSGGTITRDYLHPFECVGAPGVRSLFVIVNSREPINSTWSAVVTVTTITRVCAQYGINDSGKQVCVRFRDETVQSDRSLSGALSVAAGPRG